MAQLKDLIVSGVTRCLGKLYASELVGKLTGTADRAIADNNGANIANTYIKDLSIDNATGSTITFTRGNNTTDTLTVRGTEYSLATDSNLGLVKLYSGSGNNTDGVMTQNAVTSLINSMHTFEISIVDVLPQVGTSHILYFVPMPPGSDSDADTLYEEFVWITTVDPDTSETTGYYEKIGMTTVDLDNYYTKSEVDGLLADKLDADDLVDATDINKGITKIYSTTGQNTDGTMTQKAISDAINSVYISPAFTGTPTAPTVNDYTDNSTKIATTAFVQAAVQHAIEQLIDSGEFGVDFTYDAENEKVIVAQ